MPGNTGLEVRCQWDGLNCGATEDVVGLPKAADLAGTMQSIELTDTNDCRGLLLSPPSPRTNATVVVENPDEERGKYLWDENPGWIWPP